MKFKLVCNICNLSIWIRGDYDYETNATELDDNDSAWEDGCKHITNGDFEITDSEYDDDED